ncbi:MAG: hypothetical protein NTW86_16505 [Candidatus Sumerlaeota bacterium]|nr:hypothetical protein [Candidatus Sumerlaeota bacterium]
MSHNRVCLLVGVWLVTRVAFAEPQLTFQAGFDQTDRLVDYAGGLDLAACREAQLAPGKFGQALRVDRSENDVWLDARGNLDKARGTISLWYKPEESGGQHPLVWSDSAIKQDWPGLRISYDNGKIAFTHNQPGASLSAPANPRADGWLHVAATWDCAAAMALFVNGKEAQRKELSWRPYQIPPIVIGGDFMEKWGGACANGLIDDLRIYSEPLTDEQVASLCAGTLELPKGKASTEGWLGSIPLGAPSEKPARKTFELNFENGFEATSASGNGKPIAQSPPEIVEGFRGKGARFAEKQFLQYAEAGNLNKPQGTISLWYRADSAEAPEKGAYLLREEGPNEKGINTLWLWVYLGGLRFDLRDPDDLFVTNRTIAFTPDRWRHIVVTWDCRRNRSMYIDGQLLASGKNKKDSKMGFTPLSWPPIEHPSFFLGAENARGQRAAQGAIDEVCLFDAMLTADEVRKLYESYPERPAPVAVSTPEFVARSSGRPESQASMPSIQSMPSIGMRPEGRTPNLKMLEKIDLASALGPDQFTDSDGKSHVVESPLGKYREADPARHSRFAVEFHVEHLGKTHRIVWKYPDDKARTMDVIVQQVAIAGNLDTQFYTVHAGAFTGDEYPLTNRMVEQGAFFWPDQKDQAVIFMTAMEGQPAAASEVAIYEVEDGLPAAPVEPYTGKTPARHAGIYYEDPVLPRNLATAPTFPDFANAGDRLVEYMQWFGQDFLMYPSVWYEGPLYHSTVEYCPYEFTISRPHPPMYLTYLAKRLDAAGMKFVPTFNVQQMQSLNDEALLDEEAVRGGAETPLNMMWHNHLKSYGWHGSDPYYNCLAPRVQSQIKALVREQTEMLKDIPSFAGIALHITQISLLAFGSLDSGYNDGNLKAFQKETGAQIPVDPEDPARFFKSYQWLMTNARKEWIDWRCAKVGAFYAELARIVTDARPGAQLIVKPDILGQEARIADSYRHPDGFNEAMREAGLDMVMLSKVPGVSFERTIFPADYRWRRAHQRDLPEHADTRTNTTATRAFRTFAALPDTGINMHDRYWEDAIGETAPMEGLWGAKENRWRVSTLNPSPAYILEDYAAPLGESDVFCFTKGGFVLGFWGVEEPIREFTRAFRALPAVKFTDVKGLSDPAAVRVGQADGKQFLYAVNRFQFPVSCALRCNGAGAKIIDLASDEALEAADGALRVELGPFQLRSFRVEGGALRIAGSEETIDLAVSADLLKQLDAYEARLRAVGERAGDPKEFAHYIQQGRQMAERKHWAELYYLLQENWAKRLDAMR